MKYFCAQCQQKFNVTDISANLYAECHQEIINNLQRIRESVSDSQEALLSRIDSFSQFCNNERLFAKYLMLDRSQIQQRLINPVWNSTSLSGKLELTLQWLIDVYSSSGAAAADDADPDKEQGIALSSINASLRSRILYSKYMDFVFFPVKGSKNELVFDYITPHGGESNQSNSGSSFARVCPHCGKIVSRAVGRAQEIVIGLLGSPRAGKTSCVTAIASALYSNRYSRYGLTVEIFNNDNQWQRLKHEIDEYDAGYVVTKTPEGQTEVPSYSLLVRLGQEQKGLIERVFTFVDMPGEFWQKGNGITDDFYKQYAGIYENIDCTWFFLNKLAVHQSDLGEDHTKDELRKLMDANAQGTAELSSAPGDMRARIEEERRQKKRQNQIRLQRETADTSETIGGAIAANISANLNLLRGHLESHGHQMPPFSFIITKTEVLCEENNADEINNLGRYNLFPVENGQILQHNLAGRNEQEFKSVLGYSPEKRCFYIKEEEFFAKNKTLWEFVKNTNNGMHLALEGACPRRFYISMAAYGHLAKRRDKDPNDPTYEFEATPPTPYHEMYPLLWTLAITGALHIHHACIWHKPSLGDILFRTGGGTNESNYMNVPFDCATPAGSSKRNAKESEQDAHLLWKDISANMLLYNQKGLSRLYTVTKFNHPRR